MDRCCRRLGKTGPHESRQKWRSDPGKRSVVGLLAEWSIALGWDLRVPEQRVAERGGVFATAVLSAVIVVAADTPPRGDTDRGDK